MTQRMTMMGYLIVAVWVSGCSMLPGGSRSVEIRELNRIKHVAVACHVFAVDRGVLPAKMADLKPYVDGPIDLNRYELVATGKLGDIADPAGTILLRSTAVSSRGNRAVAFVDGHCELVPEEP